MISPADVIKTLFYSGVETDKILGILSGSLTVPATSGFFDTQSASATLTTGFNDSCYFQGIFSYDNGVTWNDFGTNIPDLSDPTQPAFQTVDCNCYSDINTIVVTASSTASYFPYATPIYTVMYKIVLFNKIGQGLITPLPVTEDIYFSSAYNYQKIFSEAHIPYNTSAGSAFTYTTAHNLGYVPNARVFQVSSAAKITPIGSIAPEIKLDSTNLTIFTDAALTTTQNSFIDYRLYYDP